MEEQEEGKMTGGEKKAWHGPRGRSEKAEDRPDDRQGWEGWETVGQAGQVGAWLASVYLCFSLSLSSQYAQKEGPVCLNVSQK